MMIRTKICKSYSKNFVRSLRIMSHIFIMDDLCDDLPLKRGFFPKRDSHLKQVNPRHKKIYAVRVVNSKLTRDFKLAHEWLVLRRIRKMVRMSALFGNK